MPLPAERPAASSWWILDPRRSLRARATLAVGVGALLFAASIAVVAGGLLRRQMESQLGPRFEMLAFQISDKLERTLQERQRQLQLLVALPVFRAWSGTPAERRQALEAVLFATPDVAWLGFVDPTGQVVVGTQGRFEHVQVASEPWFRAAREQPAASDVHELPQLATAVDETDETGSREFVTLALPVRSAQGDFAGVLAAHLRWRVARDVQFSVVSDVARRERIGVSLYGSQGQTLFDSGALGWTEPPALPRVPTARRWRGSFVEKTAEGPTFLTGYALSREARAFRGLGWFVTVRQPIERAFAPVRELQRAILGWGAALATVGVAITWIWMGRLARRLTSVGASARRIRQGDVLATLPRPAGQMEMDRMCAELGELVDDLRARHPEPAAAPPSESRPW